MEKKVKAEVREKIKKHLPKISEYTGKSPMYIYRCLYKQTHNLAKKDLARAIRRYTKLRVEDLYESE